MKVLLRRAVRRWRWEWLAIIFAIICYSSCGYSCARYMFFRPEITAEESKLKFDSRMAEVQTLLQGYYGVALHEVGPWNDTRYMRRMSGEFSKGELDISFENENGRAETYTFKMELVPGATPEQALPDVESIQMACRVFSVMSGGELSTEFIEKQLITQIEDAREQLSGFEPRAHSGYIYLGDGSDVVHFDVHQDDKAVYSARIKFISDYF